MRRAIALMCSILLLCTLLFSACAPAASTRESVHIVMSATEAMSDAGDNYYRQWLEEQTGLDITLELVDSDYMAEYLRLLFLSEETGVDAVFFSPEDGVTAELVEAHGAQGDILALDSFVGGASAPNIETLFGFYPAYDLEQALTAADGHLYYMPNINQTSAQTNAQTLWMNTAWLQESGMTIPLTTEDFAGVLRAFNERNAALGDEAGVPVAGSGQDAQFLLHYLMNAFVYTDPQNAYLAVEDGRVYFAPTSGEWRQGLSYCRSLYQEGLLPGLCLSFTEAQFVRMVNDPRDLVGGFTAASIGDVLSAGTPALSSRYIHIPPLAGPGGARNTVVKTVLPTPGGVITSTCENPQAVFNLMDFMLGEEAYLVAAFGQQGVDWDYAGVGDIGYDGNPALLTVTSPEWDRLPGRHFFQAGPFVTYRHYADGVAWSGYQADQRYLDARAARVYQAYRPDEYIQVLSLDGEERLVSERLRSHAKQMMIEFVTGGRDPADEDTWQEYLKTFDDMGLDKLLEAAQSSYGEHKGD